MEDRDTQLGRSRKGGALRNLIALMCLCALIVAACGGGGASDTTSDEDDGDTTTTEAASDTTEATTATTEAEDSESDEWDAVLEAAAEEEPLLYTQKVEVWSEEFRAAVDDRTGLELQVAPRASTGVLLERVTAEQEAGGTDADLLTVTGPDVWVERPEWFLDLSELNLPNYESYPEESKFNDKCIIFSYGLQGITYNTDLVDPDQVPETWEDMTDPYWQDQVVLTDPRSSPTYMGWAVVMGEDLGQEFLQEVAGQNPDLVTSASPGAEQVAAGAYYASFPAYPSNSVTLREQGAPLAFVVPQDRTFAVATCAGIFANTEDLNAAKVMLNELMEPEVQGRVCATEESGSPLPDAPCAQLPENITTDVSSAELVGQDEAQARVLDSLGIDTGG